MLNISSSPFALSLYPALSGIVFFSGSIVRPASLSFSCRQGLTCKYLVVASAAHFPARRELFLRRGELTSGIPEARRWRSRAEILRLVETRGRKTSSLSLSPSSLSLPIALQVYTIRGRGDYSARYTFRGRALLSRYNLLSIVAAHCCRRIQWSRANAEWPFPRCGSRALLFSGDRRRVAPAFSPPPIRISIIGVGTAAA